MAMLEIVADETGEATRIIRIGVFVVVVFFGTVAGWGAWVPISGAIIADGMVKIDTKRKTVQHLEGGVIKEILIREGDFVAEGQPLVIIEDSGVRSELNIFKDQLSAQLAKEARLLAERKFTDTIKFPVELAQASDPKIREILGNEQALFFAKRKSINGEIAAIRVQIGHAKQEESSVLSEIEAADESIRYKEERVRAGEILSAKQFIQMNEFLRLKEGLAEKREALGELKARLAVTKQRQAELERHIITLRNEYAKTADDEIKETRRVIYELQEKIRPIELTVQRFHVLAPMSGQVIDLKVTTVGGVVRPGDPLMDLVPKIQDLIVEAKVMTRDKDNVYMGQSADVALTAFKGIPHVNGVVVYVSGDALEDQTVPDHPYYLTHVRVNADALQEQTEEVVLTPGMFVGGVVGGGVGSDQRRQPSVTLAPGMPVTVYLQTQPRTLFEILLKPLVDAAGRGLRQDS